MNRFLTLLLAASSALLHSSPIQAQTFEVASVRVNRAGTAGGEGREKENIYTSPGSLTMKNVSLQSCMKWAFGLRDFQIVNAPEWFSTERYDIAAKASGPAAENEVKNMLQSLILERFHVQMHEEPKQLPVYALVPAASGVKLKVAAGNEPAGMRPRGGALEFRNVSMPEFAQRLSQRPLALERPVIDKTGLTGVYDFALKFADNIGDLKSAMEEIDRGGGQSIATAIRQQLGLKLEPEKAALRVLVIQSAEKIPDEN